MDQPTDLMTTISEHSTALERLAASVIAIWPVSARVLFSICQDLNNQSNPSSAINYELYNGTGESAVAVCAAGIVTTVSPRDNTWFNLRYRDPRKNKLPGVAKFQKDWEEIFYGMLAQSNYYEFNYEFAYAGTWACTAAGFIEPDYVRKVVNFTMLPIGSFFIAEDSAGRVDTLMRYFWMEAREVLKRWPDLDARVATGMKNNPYIKHKIRHLVRPRDSWTPDDLTNKNFAWESTYTMVEDNLLLEEGGYKRFPFLVWRFERQSNTPYGTGPGAKIIRDGQVLQVVSEDLLKADAMTLNPVLQAPEGLRSKGIPNHPGGILWAPDNLLGKTGPINKGINRMVGVDREERLLQSLKTYFYFDFLLLDVQENKVKTRAEYLGKKAATAAVFAPVIGRFTSEAIDPMWPMLFDYASEFGILPEVPDAVKNMDGGMEIEYQSPLSTLQQRAHQQAGVEAFIGQLSNLNVALAQSQPQVTDAFKSQDIVDLLAESNGISSILTDKNYRDISAKQRQQALVMQAQQQAQLQGMAASQGQAPK